MDELSKACWAGSNSDRVSASLLVNLPMTSPDSPDDIALSSLEATSKYLELASCKVCKLPFNSSALSASPSPTLVAALVIVPSDVTANTAPEQLRQPAPVQC